MKLFVLKKKAQIIYKKHSSVSWVEMYAQVYALMSWYQVHVCIRVRASKHLFMSSTLHSHS